MPIRVGIARARGYYDLGLDREGDLSVLVAVRRIEGVRPAVRDAEREERATRHWFEHRSNGWSPADIVVRSSLYEVEAWHDPGGLAA